MPICIAGMHRSGTSMVARMLMCCGLDLGPADLFPKPGRDNPEGFWESLPFQSTNQQLLARNDTAWQIPPDFEDGWERDERYADLRTNAAKIPAEIGMREPWGWKDPRNSILLPFWTSIWPDLRVVICVRNPIDVAVSLMARDRMTITAGLRLWLTYQRRLLDAVPPERRIVTHYDSFFADARAELVRLLGLLGMKASEDSIHRASETIVTNLRHSCSRMIDVEYVRPPMPLLETYRKLCAEAGTVFAESERGVAACAPMSDAVATAMRLEEHAEQQSGLIRVMMKEWRALEQSGIEANPALCEFSRQLRESRRKVEQQALQIRDHEERLSARRHRYAERIAAFMHKLFAPVRGAKAAAIQRS